MENREEVREEMLKEGVETGIHFERSTSYTPFDAHPTPKMAKYYSDRILSLPLHLHLSESEQIYVIDTFKKVNKTINGK